MSNHESDNCLWSIYTRKQYGVFSFGLDNQVYMAALARWINDYEGRL